MYEIYALVTRGSSFPLSVVRFYEQCYSEKPICYEKDLINRWLNLPMDEAIEAGIQSLALAYVTYGTPKVIKAFWDRRGKQ